jgi:hypothetical protein
MIGQCHVLIIGQFPSLGPSCNSQFLFLHPSVSIRRRSHDRSAPVAIPHSRGRRPSRRRPVLSE